ncbi:hypothetical protein BH23ACT9_BH23ACT9_07580 [soil metagenome]
MPVAAQQPSPRQDEAAGHFPPGVEVAYIATGEAFADALAGGPLAGGQRAPILEDRGAVVVRSGRTGGIPCDVAAGTTTTPLPLPEVPAEQIDRTLRTNVLGTLHGCRVAAAGMVHVHHDAVDRRSTAGRHPGRDPDQVADHAEDRMAIRDRPVRSRRRGRSCLRGRPRLVRPDRAVNNPSRSGFRVR